MMLGSSIWECGWNVVGSIIHYLCETPALRLDPRTVRIMNFTFSKESDGEKKIDEIEPMRSEEHALMWYKIETVVSSNAGKHSEANLTQLLHNIAAQGTTYIAHGFSNPSFKYSVSSASTSAPSSSLLQFPLPPPPGPMYCASFPFGLIVVRATLSSANASTTSSK